MSDSFNPERKSVCLKKQNLFGCRASPNQSMPLSLLFCLKEQPLPFLGRLG